MQKVLLLLFFFLLNGCALNRVFLADEIDKVYVVKHTSYVKYHRAYFTRTDLKPIRNGKKYLYFYHTKKHDLAILLHPKKQYRLYSLSYPDKKEMILKSRHHTSYRTLLKYLKHQGYHLTTPEKVGYISHVSLRRYKGIKTLLVEVEDYSRLQNLYQKAIRTYDAKKIKSIQAKLPKQFIAPYYKHYHARAKTEQQLQQLQIIATKLRLNTKGETTQHENNNTIKEAVTEATMAEEAVTEKTVTEEKKPKKVKVSEVIEKPKKAAKPYNYYLNKASFNELDTYLSQGSARDDLTYNQYRKLREKRDEEKLLEDGSLEELLEAYKKNNDPRFKTRILLLMKKTQARQ